MTRITSWPVNWPHFGNYHHSSFQFRAAAKTVKDPLPSPDLCPSAFILITIPLLGKSRSEDTLDLLRRVVGVGWCWGLIQISGNITGARCGSGQHSGLDQPTLNMNTLLLSITLTLAYISSAIQGISNIKPMSRQEFYKNIVGKY